MVDQHKPRETATITRTQSYLKVTMRVLPTMCMKTRMYLYNTVCITYTCMYPSQRELADGACYFNLPSALLQCVWPKITYILIYSGNSAIEGPYEELH